MPQENINIGVYKKIFENMNESVVILNNTGNIVYANISFCNLLWYELDELIWKNTLEMWDENSLDMIMKHRSLLEKWKKVTCEWFLKNKSWDFVPVHVNWTPLPWWWMAWIMTDLRKIRVLQEVEEKLSKWTDIWHIKIELDDSVFKRIIETMLESVWIWNDKEETVYANPNFCNLLWYKLDEMKGEKSYVFWDQESADRVKQHNRLRVKWKKSKYEWKLKAKDWTLIPVLLSGTPLPWWWTAWIMTDLREIQAIKEAESMLNDSTTRVIQANKELKQQLRIKSNLQRELNTQIEALNNSAIVVETDLKWNITFINKYFESVSWYKKEDLIGRNLRTLYSNDYTRLFWKDFWENLKSNKLRKGELKSKAVDWTYYWIRTVVTPFFDENWNIYKYVFISYDITDIKNLHEMKDSFLSIASHELRTPMTTIKWKISMILDGDTWWVNESTKQFLETVYNNTNQLIRLVNDMLDLSKHEAMKMKYDDKYTLIQDVLKGIYNDFIDLVKEKNITLLVNVSENIKNKYILIDEWKLKQVLTNLLSNAYKFTPEGGQITVTCSSTESGNVLINIMDTWVWIPYKHLDKIFEKFHQSKTPLKRSIKGTWLWLCICKEILKYYWSDLKVESKEWEWSVFYFELPLHDNDGLWSK